MASTEVNNVDHRAPNVKHLVYSMYRKMLDGYNDQANEIVDALPRDIVQEDADIYNHLREIIKQQHQPASPGQTPSTEGVQGPPLPPPPPPPSFPSSIPGRRLKTEIPERGLEPPPAIQNAMLTKDKKPFTYTPGGIDLSEIRSPKMQRRINRNACAEEMTGRPAPTTNQPVPTGPPPSTPYSAMQSQLPTSVLPARGMAPPPPPPMPQDGVPPPPPPMPAPSSAAPSVPQQPKPPAFHKPPQMGFDPNEILARANRNQPQEPAKTGNVVPEKKFEEESPIVEPPANKPQSPGQIYVPPITPKSPVEAAPAPPVANHTPRGQLGSIYVPPVSNTSQEQGTPSPVSPFGQKVQSPATPQTAPGSAEVKQQAPWVTVYRTPQAPAWMSSRQPESPKVPESPKPANTRIIPIQIEGRDPPKPQPQQSYGAQPQQQFNNKPAYASQQQQFANESYNNQQQQPSNVQIQQETKQQSRPQTRVIPIQIEGASPQPGFQPKFNPMTPTSPTPYTPPSADKEQKPQWAPVQPRPFDNQFGQQRGQSETRTQQQQPEYGTYNTAGVPLSQLRKMQLSDDDKALMDKFKSQVEKHKNDAITDENANPRYRGGHIPSRVFKMLDESVDEERYLHQESDPRYRGASIPSRAFRLLQNMTDTAGDLPQQVPKGPMRAPTSRPPPSAPEPPAGPYIPASEQQVQEPRKYTGGSIPSRSFRMLQAMTGQEMTAPNHAKANSSSGRSTPVPPMGRWCPSPVPPQFEPYWYLYHSDPFLMYNYGPDINAAYAYLPPQPYPTGRYTPNHFQPHPNCLSDSDEQGYSSTDELGQYYMNYRNNIAYPPFMGNPESYYGPDEYAGSRCSTPGIMITPPAKKSATPLLHDKKGQTQKKVAEVVKSSENENRSAETDSTSSEDDSETDTDEEHEISGELNESDQKLGKSGTLRTLKSVSDVGLYGSESAATMTNEDEWEEGKKVEEDEEDEDDDDDDEESTSESIQVSQDNNLPHQLSVIYEESEHSDAESMRQKSTTKSVTSESDVSNLENGEEESDDDALDTESSVTVRLPLRLKFSRGENDEDVTTVIVGDSEVRKSDDAEEATEEEEEDDEDADVSVTLSLPTRSNSVISIEKKAEIADETSNKVEEEKNEGDAEVTVSLSLKKPKSPVEEKPTEEGRSLDRLSYDSKTEESDSNHFEDDSSSTSADTVVKHKEDSDEEDNKMEDFKTWLNNENERDWNEKTVESKDEDSYEAGVERLEKMISSMLEKTKGSLKVQAQNSQEESEDDSGVTSDISAKHLASETDTESDYSELSKMTQFQRASTHSRLFRLLQEECGSEDGVEEEKKKGPNPSGSCESLASRKQRLTLPLNTSCEIDSLSSSSGVASPASPTVTDRLVKELVQSLLHKKKGKKFRKLPLAKLHAAALRILQEDMDPYDTSSNSASGDDGFLLSPNATHSPRAGETEAASPNVIYGANYYDYVDYYNTWGSAAASYYPEQEIVPSKAFRMLSLQHPAAMDGLRAKCPRIPAEVAETEEVAEKPTGRQTPCVIPRDQYSDMSFSEKREKVAKVLENGGKC